MKYIKITGNLYTEKNLATYNRYNYLERECYLDIKKI